MDFVTLLEHLPIDESAEEEQEQDWDEMDVDLSKQLLLDSWVNLKCRFRGGRAGRLLLRTLKLYHILLCHVSSWYRKLSSAVVDLKNEFASVFLVKARCLYTAGV